MCDYNKRNQVKYCSKKCINRITYKRKKLNSSYTKECNKCGDLFKTTDNYAKYCSDNCYKETISLYRSDCEVCGSRFKGRKGRANKFCSRECYHNSLGSGGFVPHKTINSTTDYNSMKRAKRYGVQVEGVNTLEVFERDGWTCGICNERVDKDIPYPCGKSASLDHIIPMSKGGGHTYDNTQLAHLKCNLKKNDNVIIDEVKKLSIL